MYEEEEAVVEEMPVQQNRPKSSTHPTNDEGDNLSRNSSSPQPFVDRWKTSSLSNVGKLRNIFSGRSRPKTTSSGTIVPVSDSDSRPVSAEYYDEAPDQALGDRPSFEKMVSSYQAEERSPQQSATDSLEKPQQNDELNITPSRLSEELRLNSQKLQQLGSIIEWKDRRIARLEDSIRKLEATKIENSEINRAASTDNATETPTTELNEQCVQVSPEIADSGSDGSHTESEVSEEVEKLRSGLMDKDCKLQAVKSDLWGVTIEYEQLEEKFDQVRHDLDKAFHDLDSTRKDVQVFRRKTESLEARKFHLEEVVQVKDLQIQQLMHQVNNSASDRAEMSMCFSQIDEHIHNLEASFAQKSLSAAEMEEEINRLHFVVEEGVCRERYLQEELNRKCEMLSEKDCEVRHMYVELARKENICSELNSMVESRQNEMGELRGSLQASFENTEELCRTLHEKDSECCDMEREIWNLRERCTELEKTNAEMQNQMACGGHIEENVQYCRMSLDSPNFECRQEGSQQEEQCDPFDGECETEYQEPVTQYSDTHTNTEDFVVQKTKDQEPLEYNDDYVLSLEAELHVAKIVNAALEEEVNEPWDTVEKNDNGSQSEEEMACCRWSPSGDGIVCSGQVAGSNGWTDAFDELLEKSWSAIEKLEYGHWEPNDKGNSFDEQFEEEPQREFEIENIPNDLSFDDLNQNNIQEDGPVFEYEQQCLNLEEDFHDENVPISHDEARFDGEGLENTATKADGGSELEPMERHGDYRLQQIINFLEEEKAVMEKDLKEVFDRSCWFEQENQRLNFQLGSMGDYNRGLEDKLGKLEEEHRNVQHETQEAKAQLKGIIANLSEFHEKAAHHTEANKSQVKRLQEEVDEAMESENILKDSLAQKLQELHDLSENFESLRDEHREVCRNTDSMKDELCHTSHQLASLQDQLSTKNGELQQRCEELLRLRQNNEELDNVRTGMENELGVAREKMQALEELSERNSQQIVEAEQEIENLASSKSDLEALLRKSDGQLQQALNDVHFFRDQLNTLEREKAQAEEQSQMRNPEGDNSHSNIREVLDRKMKEFEHFLRELEANQQQVSELTERLRGTEGELQNMRKNEQDYQARIEELQIDRVAVAKELSSVDVELEKLRGLLQRAAKSNGLDERELWSVRSSEVSSVQEPSFAKSENSAQEERQFDNNNKGPNISDNTETNNFSSQLGADGQDQKPASENVDGIMSFDQRSQLELAQAEIAVLRSENVDLELKHSHVEAVIEKQHEALMAAANDLLQVRENLQRDIKEMRDVTRMTILNQDQQFSNLRKEFSRSSVGGYESKHSRSSFASSQPESDSVVRDLIGFCDVTMRRMADENKKCQSVMGQLVQRHTELLDVMGKKLRRMDQSDKSLKVLDEGARSYTEMASELKSIIAQLSEGGTDLIDKSSETAMKNLQKHLQQLNGILSLIKAKKNSKASTRPENDEKNKQIDTTSSSSSEPSEKDFVQPKSVRQFEKRHSRLPSELEELCGRLVEADKELRVWRSQGSMHPHPHRRKVSFVGSSGDSAASTTSAVRGEEPSCTCSVSRKQAGGDITRSSAKDRGGQRLVLSHEDVYRTDRGRRD